MPGFETAVIAALAGTGTWAAVGTTITSTALGGFLFKSAVGRLLVSVAISALMAPSVPKIKAPGIRNKHTSSGGTTPETFIIGRYATAGHLVCPPMSHGSSGGAQNAYLTLCIEIASLPGHNIHKIILDGEDVPFGVAADHPEYGQVIGGRFLDHAWIRYHDGRQTAADSMLLAKYGSYPERPWTADMIGTGICYAIITLKYNTKVFRGVPKIRFVVTGIPLYDPRYDSTNGGVGLQRRGYYFTGVTSENTAVQIYNILRGIHLPGNRKWGGDVQNNELPLANWRAQMNKADEAVLLRDDHPLEGTSLLHAWRGNYDRDHPGLHVGKKLEPKYRTGYEIKLSDEPAKIIEELLKGANGELAEIGGVFNCRLGPPASPTIYMTDDDIIVTEGETLSPFGGSVDLVNTVSPAHPSPVQLWEDTQAHKYTETKWLAEDGGQIFPLDLPLPSVPFPGQVQRVAQAAARDTRRLIIHSLTLPAHAAALQPLDVISWTSAKNGYVAKLFEVKAMTDPLIASAIKVVIRETNVTDSLWSVTDEQQVPSVSVTTVPSVATSSVTSPNRTDYTNRFMFYFGYSSYAGSWLVQRQHRGTSHTTNATMSNNTTITTFDAAWTARDTLTYA